jgi:hypothetical protein
MPSAVASGCKRAQSLAVLVCAAAVAAGCGDAQEPRSTAPSTQPPSASTQPPSTSTQPSASTRPPSAVPRPAGSAPATPAAGDPSWREYYPLRVGYECVLGATLKTESISLTSRQTQTVSSVRKVADGTRVVLHTRSVTTAPGIPPSAVTLDVPYVFVDDGTLRASPGLTTTLGLRVSYRGFQVFPSVPDLRRGRSSRSKVSMSISATTDAMRRVLARAFDGRESLDLDLVYDVGAAPDRRAIATPAGRYTDVIGITINLSSFHIHDAPNDVDAATNGTIRALVGNGITSYFAKGVGMVLTESSGSFGKTSVRLRRCASS